MVHTGVVGAHNKMWVPRLSTITTITWTTNRQNITTTALHPYLYSSGSVIPDTPPQLWDIIESQSWNLTYNYISKSGHVK